MSGKKSKKKMGRKWRRGWEEDVGKRGRRYEEEEVLET